MSVRRRISSSRLGVKRAMGGRLYQFALRKSHGHRNANFAFPSHFAGFRELPTVSSPAERSEAKGSTARTDPRRGPPSLASRWRALLAGDDKWVGRHAQSNEVFGFHSLDIYRGICGILPAIS